MWHPSGDTLPIPLVAPCPRRGVALHLHARCFLTGLPWRVFIGQGWRLLSSPSSSPNQASFRSCLLFLFLNCCAATPQACCSWRRLFHWLLRWVPWLRCAILPRPYSAACGDRCCFWQQVPDGQVAARSCASPHFGQDHDGFRDQPVAGGRYFFLSFL